MKRYILSFILSVQTLAASAQMPSEIKFISMQEFLPYILPFYIITMLALGVFIHKLMRPHFPTKWVYITAIVGIVGAGIIAYKFKNFRIENIDANTPEINFTDNLDEAKYNNEKSNEVYGDFWRIAVPNCIILLLGIAVDIRNKKAADTQK